MCDVFYSSIEWLIYRGLSSQTHLNRSEFCTRIKRAKEYGNWGKSLSLLVL
ncbi:hypothetical protein HanXRQr2_Chr05g0195291 [Helianthus annuus]|uniref:Uncharacterized protein n=1 Tax=Helianthus annuus TaxID=4232 RepID=A0A251RM99_HELAN|nr:hypothetical protein HanXRQr2_Chr05g0195291 [Helianthus annuus]